MNKKGERGEGERERKQFVFAFVRTHKKKEASRTHSVVCTSSSIYAAQIEPVLCEVGGHHPLGARWVGYCSRCWDPATQDPHGEAQRALLL